MCNKLRSPPPYKGRLFEANHDQCCLVAGRKQFSAQSNQKVAGDFQARTQQSLSRKNWTARMVVPLLVFKHLSLNLRHFAPNFKHSTLSEKKTFSVYFFFLRTNYQYTAQHQV